MLWLFPVRALFLKIVFKNITIACFSTGLMSSRRAWLSLWRRVATSRTTWTAGWANWRPPAGRVTSRRSWPPPASLPSASTGQPGMSSSVCRHMKWCRKEAGATNCDFAVLGRERRFLFTVLKGRTPRCRWPPWLRSSWIHPAGPSEAFRAWWNESGCRWAIMTQMFSFKKKKNPACCILLRIHFNHTHDQPVAVPGGSPFPAALRPVRILQQQASPRGTSFSSLPGLCVADPPPVPLLLWVQRILSRAALRTCLCFSVWDLFGELHGWEVKRDICPLGQVIVHFKTLVWKILCSFFCYTFKLLATKKLCFKPD